jgi:hypothetical protein
MAKSGSAAAKQEFFHSIWASAGIIALQLHRQLGADSDHSCSGADRLIRPSADLRAQARNPLQVSIKASTAGALSRVR